MARREAALRRVVAAAKSGGDTFQFTQVLADFDDTPESPTLRKQAAADSKGKRLALKEDARGKNRGGGKASSEEEPTSDKPKSGMCIIL